MKDYEKVRSHKSSSGRSPSYHKSSSRSKKQSGTGSSSSHKLSKLTSTSVAISGADRKSRKSSPLPMKSSKSK